MTAATPVPLFKPWLGYSRPFATHYYAPSWCSGAILVAFVFLASLTLLPYFLAYATQSFWLKENSYREQPYVVYRHSFLLQLDGDNVASTNGNSYPFPPVSLIWSSDADYNMFVEQNARTCTVKVAAVDYNTDGKNDYFDISMSMPLLDTELIHHARLALMFQYQLTDRVQLSMPVMVMIDASSALSGQAVDFDGNLQLLQRQIFPSFADLSLTTLPLNFSLIRSMDAQGLSWPRLLHDYGEWNVRGEFSSTTPPFWTATRAAGQPFTLTGRIYIPQQRVYYIPGVNEVLKNGWIQYLAYVVLIGAVLWPLWIVLCQSGLLDAVMVVDYVPVLGGGGKVYEY